MVFPLGDSDRTRIVPVVTYLLIASNVAVYLFQQGTDEAFTVAYAVTPYEITHNRDLTQPTPMRMPGDEDPLDLPGRVDLQRPIIPHAPTPIPIYLTLLTAMFLHGSPLHLAGNMLFLWIFGDNVEEVLGHARYVLVYLACGVAGSLAQIAGAGDSIIPTLGASGAIAGVMGAYLVWFPYNRVRVLLLRIIIELPALVVIGFWIAMQVWEGVGSVGRLGQAGGVAYFAHIGGAVVGLGVAFLFHDRAREVRALKTQVGWYRPT